MSMGIKLWNDKAEKLIRGEQIVIDYSFCYYQFVIDA